MPRRELERIATSQREGVEGVLRGKHKHELDGLHREDNQGETRELRQDTKEMEGETMEEEFRETRRQELRTTKEPGSAETKTACTQREKCTWTQESITSSLFKSPHLLQSPHFAGQSFLRHQTTFHRPSVAAPAATSCTIAAPSGVTGSRPTTIQSGRRIDALDGGAIFQGSYAAKHCAPLRGYVSTILGTPFGQGNPLEAYGEMRAH